MQKNVAFNATGAAQRKVSQRRIHESDGVELSERMRVSDLL
jgi:hypothetical protein